MGSAKYSPLTSTKIFTNVSREFSWNHLVMFCTQHMSPYIPKADFSTKPQNCLSIILLRIFSVHVLYPLYMPKSNSIKAEEWK